MKPPHSNLRTTLLNAALVTAITQGSALQAANLTWDSNGIAADVTNGAGTWDNTATNWWNGAANVAWTDGDTAIIGTNPTSGAGGTISFAAGVDISALGLVVNDNGNATNHTLAAPALGSMNFTIGTGGITANDGITISQKFFLGGDQSWTRSATGNGALTITGEVDDNLVLRNLDISSALGSGTVGVILRGAAFHDGTTSIGNGWIQARHDAFGLSSITLNGTIGGAHRLQFVNAAGTGVTGTLSNPVALGAGKEGNFYIWGGFTTTLTEPVTGGDALSVLRKTDGGALVLEKDSTYTGATIVDAGTLRLGTGGTTGSIDSSASLTINGSGILSIQRSGATNLSAILPANAAESFSPFSANDGQINFNGPSQSDTLTIDQDIGTAPTFGQLRVTSGTMTLPSGTDLQIRTLSVGHTTVASGNVGTLNVGAGVNITLGTGALAALNLGDSGGNAGIMNMSGGSLSTASNATGSIRIGHWAGTGSVLNMSGGSISTPSGRLAVGWDGEGTLNMTGGVISAFAISIDGNGAGPASVANLDGGELRIGGNGMNTLGQGTIVANGGKILSTASNTIAVPRTISAGGLTIGFGSLTTNATVTDNSVTTGTGPLTIVNESATGLKNYTINTNSPAYSGAVSVPDGVRLWLQQPNALGTGTATIVSGSGAFLTSSTAPYPLSFDLTGNGWLEPTSSEAFGALRLQTATVSGSVNIGAGGARITAHSGSNGTITGTLTGSSALEINSTQPSNNGTVTLAGNGTGFTGPITVPQGRLNVSGSVGGNVSVVNGATLGGEGSAGGNLILGGATPATLNINPVTPGALTIGGNVTLTGINTVSFTPAPTSTGTFTVLAYSGTLTGTPGTNLVLANASNYRATTWNDTGGEITLSVSNKNLEWTSPTTGTWDVGVSSSWTDGSASSFYWGDNVTFPDLAADTAIAISGGEVAPASMNFTANTTAYTLTAAGTAQVETATAAGATTADGTIQVTVTAVDLPGSPLVIPVAITTGQAATAWAGTVRTALGANTAITTLYTVGGTGATITLTRKADAGGRFPANDPALNLALDNGVPSPGITTALASANTTGGVLTQRIAGNGTLLKSGSALLTMSGTNAYTGGTTLSKGETRVRSTGALGTGTVTLGDANTGASNVSLYLDDTARVNFNTPVVISNNGTGAMTLGSRTTASGSGDNHQFTNITLQRDVIFDANAADRTDFETISGTGNITINGAGRAVFATANTFVGNLTLNNTNVNALQLGTNSTAFNAIPDASNVTVNAGSTLSLSYTAGGSETIGGLFGAGIVRNNGGNANTLIVGSGNANGSFSGTINNGSSPTVGFSFTKTGSGTQTLSGAGSAYTGTTTISGGVLEAAKLASIGTNSSIGAASATTGNIVFGSAAATLRYIGSANVTTDRGFTLSNGATGAGATLEASGTGAWTIPAAIALNYGTVNEARTLTIGGTGVAANTYAGTIANNGTAATSVVKSGTGSWALTANNTFTGTLAITGGKLNLSFIGNGGAASQVGQSPKAGANLVLNGGTLAYTGINATTDRGFSTGTAGGSIEVPAATTLTFGSASSAFAFGGTLTKTGAGTLNLLSYGGGTATAGSDIVINEGVVNFGSSYFNSSPLGYRALTITVNAGGVLRTSTAHALGGDNIDAGNSLGQIRLLGGEFNLLGSQYLSEGSVAGEGRIVLEGGTITGTADFRANGAAGSVITSLASTATSTIGNTGGTNLQYGPLTLNVADGAAASDLVVSSPLNSPAASTNPLNKNGAGLLVLGGVNTYTGSTNVNAGTLELADNARLRFVIPATGNSNKLTGAGTATLKGDFAIDITAAAALSSGTWILEDAASASYESSFSVVTTAGVPWTDAGGNKWTTPGTVPDTVWTFNEADGTLTLGNVVADPYGAWETLYGIAGAGAGTDSDNDGIPNGIEFVIGGIPAGPGSESSSLLPTATTDPASLVFVFRRTTDSAEYDPYVEYGSNLAGWTPAEAGVGGVTILEEDDAFGADIDRVTVTIPRFLEVGSKMFARLRVDIP
jgi:fibronectin-binding autotransporter adhesin